MPRLPDLDSLGPRPTPQGGRPISSFEGGFVGRAMQGAAAEIGEMAKKMELEDDNTAVFSARRKLDEWEHANIYDPEKGAVTKLGADSFALPRELPAAFDKFTQEIAPTLRGARQQQAFADLVAARRNSVQSWADRHTLQQRDFFLAKEYEADLQAIQDRLVLKAGDPAEEAALLKLLGVRVVGEQQRLGQAGGTVADAVKDQTSKAHVHAIRGILASGDPMAAEKADAYLKRHVNGIHAAGDLLLVAPEVRKAMDAKLVTSTVGDVIKDLAPKFTPSAADTFMGNIDHRDMAPANMTDIDALDAAKVKAESGGRRFGKDGKLLEGPATRYGTAKGEHQVLDSTARSPGLGVKPAAVGADGKISPDEYARVGKEMFAALIRRYDGDARKALAAYNWGFGNVDKAVATAAAAGDRLRPAQEDDWVAYLPAETKTYIKRVQDNYAAGKGAPPAPTKLDVREAVRKRFAGRPELLPDALRLADAQASELEAYHKSRRESAQVEVMKALDANGGRLDLLGQGALANVDPRDRESVRAYGDKVRERLAQGDTVTKPAAYLYLSDDSRLAALSDDAFYKMRSEVSDKDWKTFAQQRDAIKRRSTEKSDKDKPGDLDTTAMNAALHPLMRTLKIDPNPKDSDTSEMMRAAAVTKVVRESLLAAQLTAGRKFNDVEITKHIHDLAVKTVGFRNTFLGMSGAVQTRPLLASQVSDIPSDVKDAIIKDLRTTYGVTDPTEGQLLEAYIKLKAQGK